MFNPILGILASSGAVAAGGSYESIATVTVGSGGSSTITFSSIPSTYKHLQIRGINLSSSSLTDVRLRFNSDSGSNYKYHLLYGDGSSAAAGAYSATYITMALGSIGTDKPSVSVTDILDYGSTSKTKTIRLLNGTDGNGSGYIVLYSGLWYATPAAITQIDISPNSGTFNQYTQYALYGIKD